MKVKCVVAPVVVLCLLQLQLSSVKADYRLEVTAHNFSNPAGTDSRGECCDTDGCPINRCDTVFIFCLRPCGVLGLGTARDSDPSNCPLGSFRPPNEFETDEIDFPPSFVFPFEGRSWPGCAQLLVEAEDQDVFFDDLIDDFYIEVSLSPGQSLPPRQISGNFDDAHTITLSFTLETIVTSDSGAIVGGTVAAILVAVVLVLGPGFI